LTELVCDLGSATELVGVTKFCEHAAAASIEKVGGTKDPDVSRVVALAPDLVLMNREENRLEDADSLAAAGVHVHSTMPVNLPETLDCIRSLGRELGKAQACELLTTGIEKAWHEVKQRAGRRGPMRYAYLIWRKPWMGAGTPSYIDALLAAAGGENVLAAADARYPIPDDTLALPVGGRDKGLTRRTWLDFAAYCQIPERAARRLISEQIEVLQPALRLISASFLPDAMQEQYEAALRANTTVLSN
jgi:hypothetical protein